MNSSVQQRQISTSFEENRQISTFEDLSNEIIYEIFEFLDFYHAYHAVYNLNIRFRDLFIRSPLPLNLNMSDMSRVTFETYCQLAVMPNQHRIKSLYISPRLSIDHFLTSFSIDESFIFLEVLTLKRISSHRLIPLLATLSSVPHLSSLTITTNELVQEPDVIHQLIFALPVLRYCNTSFGWPAGRFSLPISPGQRNAIQHLVIDSPYNLDNFILLLSCMPQLVRLSCYRLLPGNNTQFKAPILLSNLTHLHLVLSIPFNQFQHLISNFEHRLEVLCISSMPLSHNPSANNQNDVDNLNTDYLHAEQWQQLISMHIPRLRFFDLQCFGKVDQRAHHRTYQVLIEKFDSLFWITRGWLFDHQCHKYNGSTWLIFRSIHPLRYCCTQMLLQKYIVDVFRSNNSDGYPYPENKTHAHGKRSVELSDQIVISNPSMAVNYTCRPSHFTRLTLTGTLYQEDRSCISDLSRMVPLTRLTELVLTCDSFRMEQLIELLHLASNLRLLTLLTSSRCPISNEGNIDLITNDNNETMPSRGLLTLKHVQAIMRVCPRLQSLEITINENYLERIVRFLLIQDIGKTDHLFLLGLRDAHYGMIRRLQKILDVEKLIEHYTLEYISNTVYMWW